MYPEMVITLSGTALMQNWHPYKNGRIIKGLKEHGKTILLASHNQGDIDELCDTVCEMDAGVMTMIREESI